MLRVLRLTAALLAIAACGGSDSSSDPAPSPSPAASPSPAPAPSPSPSPSAGAAGPTITIRNMAFSPLSLEVAPGAVVVVQSLDPAMPHSVTSQNVPGSYTPGGVGGVSFDTGAFVGARTFTIPATAAPGTTVPYYCSTHGSTMATPNGELRIVSAPAPAAGNDPAPATPGDPYSGLRR